MSFKSSLNPYPNLSPPRKYLPYHAPKWREATAERREYEEKKEREEREERENREKREKREQVWEREKRAKLERARESDGGGQAGAEGGARVPQADEEWCCYK